MFEVLKKNLINFPGKKLQRRFLVFESDDWGTIRMPSNQVYNKLLSNNSISSNDPFSKYDSLESSSDLTELFILLSKFKDFNGNSPIITANTVIGNPDFEKMKQTNFSHYYFETFLDTYQRYPNSSESFTILQNGINERLYFPQFHAREHINLPMWMNLLQSNNKDFLEAFQYGCFSIDFVEKSNRRNNLMAAYDYYSDEDFLTIKESIEDGLKLFETIFSFKSESTVAPCYVWDSKIESLFFKNGVKYIQGSRFQNVPVKNSNSFKRKFHYNGQLNEMGQFYLSRNALFEPSLNSSVDWVDKCLESIEIAYKWNKPAVIGTHRLNFIGSLVPENRNRNLVLFATLLKKILKKWPDVEFVSSVDLGKEYSQKLNF